MSDQSELDKEKRFCGHYSFKIFGTRMTHSSGSVPHFELNNLDLFHRG